MKRIFKKIGLLITPILMTTFLFNGAVVYGAAQKAPSEAVLEQARQVIKAYYLDKIPEGALDNTDLQKMVDALNDPYSDFFTAEEYEEFTSSINNEFSGIGVTIDPVEEGIKIISVMNGSPALEVGIKPGDIIIEADGHPLAGAATEEAVSYIRGVSGTYVKLKIKRGQDVLDMNVMRKELTLPTVEGKLLDNHIGYIEISSFGENTANEFKTELDEVNKSNVDSYIIDLRYNPGGYIDTALDIAGYFIGNEPSVVIKDKRGNTDTLKATKQSTIIDKPVIFLINGYSASASELLSGALKDYNKAFFIGETTYGKGVGQGVFSLMDGSYLKLTTIKFTSPKGNEIHKVGVSPDLGVRTLEEETNVEKQLQVARLLLSDSTSNTDNTGVIRVGINNSVFEIKEDLLKSEEFKSSAEFLKTSVLTDDNTFVWNNNTWVKKSELATIPTSIETKNEQAVEDKNNETTDIVINVPIEDSKEVNPSENLPEVAATIEKKVDVEIAVQVEQEVKQPSIEKAAEVKVDVLPQTGYMIDSNVLIIVGTIVMLSGIGLLVRFRYKSSVGSKKSNQ